MKREGMVHALEEIHRMLKPDGRLIDIHPMLETPLIEVHQGDRILFVEPQQHSTDDIEIIGLAEETLAQVVQRGLFVVERNGEFNLITYASSIAALRAHWAKVGAYDDSPADDALEAQRTALFARVDEIMQSAGNGAEVAHHESARITRLKPVK